MIEKQLYKIALGGGCHWCTEAVFKSLIGVYNVQQGFVSSTGENTNFSEAIVLQLNTEEISIKTLVNIHLLTHKSTSNHSFRKKYRSAFYVFSSEQAKEIKAIVSDFQPEFENKIITKVYPFSAFKPSLEEFKNYYYKNPSKPFCKTYITPKLQLLLNKFSKHVKTSKPTYEEH
ncbi:MAG: peptide-methionine (S)-S-oxide reductase [Cellulophaga sp.]